MLMPGQVWIGLVVGMAYALLAVGFTMVYGILNMMNFAHGEVYMFSAFAAWWVFDLTLGTPLDIAPLAFILPLIVIVAVVVGAAISVLLELAIFRPMYARGSGRLPPIIATMGAVLAMRQIMVVFQVKVLPAPRVLAWWEFIPQSWNWYVPGLDIHFTGTALVVIGVAILAMLIIGYFVTETVGGKAMRAVSQDPDAARAMGIDLNKVIFLTFAISGALAGVGAVFIGIVYQRELYLEMDFYALIKALIATVIGGIGSIRGAVMGGVFLGVSEAIFTTIIGTNYKDVLTFTLLIVVLMVRPRGLLGESVDVYERA